jgi:two-component system sensor histidine kinase AgrC
MMINLLIRTSSLIAYAFLLEYFFSSWKTEKTRIKIYTSLLLFVIVLNISLNVLFAAAVTPYFNLISSVLLILITAKKHFLPNMETIFWTTALVAVNLACEFFSLSLIQTLLPEYTDITNQTFVVLTTSISFLFGIIAILCIKFYFFKKTTVYYSLNFLSLVSLSAFPIISISMLFVFLLEKAEISINKQLIELFITTGTIFLSLCALFLYDNLSKHLKKIATISLQHKALDAEIKYIEEVKKNQLALKELRHDLKNHSIVVLALIQQNKLNEAMQFLQESMAIPELNDDFYTPDSILNYLLSEKKLIAQKKQIRFDIQVFLSENTTVDRDILAIIVGNLIDNALAACSRYTKKERSISLVIKQIKNDLLIDIRNTFDPNEKITRRNRQLEGIGIRNIHALVQKNGGAYNYWTEEDRYHASVVLFNIYSPPEHPFQ